MNPLDPNRLLDSAAQGLAADARSLDRLKRTATQDPRAALKGAAQQFEALFLQMVLKSMRDAIPKSGLLDSDSQQTYTSMLDQQLSTKISKSGTGLASVIEKQLGRYLPGMNPGGSQPGTGQPVPGKPVTTSTLTAPLPVRAAIDRYAAVAASRHANKPALDTAADTTGAASAPAPVAEPAAAAGATSLPADQRSFVSRMWDHAVAAQEAIGIPVRFVLAQAALESGWGKHEIRDSSGFSSHNLFGIKAGSGWPGRTVDVVTTEYENGVGKKVVEKFRAYDSYAEAFRDWAQLIGTNRRYADVVESGRAGGNGARFADGLARAGYATDPDYGAKLVRVIDSLRSARAGTG